jgi:DNA-binding NarL/FixJ family response regulator
MDGYLLAAALRDLPAGRNLPLLLLSSLQTRVDPEQRAMFVASLTKPAKTPLLRERLLLALAPAEAAMAWLETAGGQRAHDAPGVGQPPLRILLAEDNAVNQRVAGLMLTKLGHRVDTVANGLEAVQAVHRARYDVVLMDVQMPKLDGVEATRRIAQDTASRSRVVILTTFERDDYVFEALRAGASGFMLKNAAPEELVRAVRIVAAGEALLAPSITRRVIEDYAQRLAPRKNDTGLDQLTERELEVLRLLATGKSNAELAKHLYLGEGTVKTHVSHVFGKLGLRDRVQAVVFAYESGLVEPGES